MNRSTIAAMLTLGLAFSDTVSAAGFTPGSALVGDIHMGYRIYGAGAPLILIMGYGSTMELWESALLDGLAADHQVIIFDNRGMGASESGTEQFSIERFADDTAGLMKAIGIPRASVLGWSMGAMIAQELALRHSDMVDKLVLYAGHAGASMFPPSQRVLDTLADTSGTPEEQGSRFIGLLFPRQWIADHGSRIAEIFYRPMGQIPPENIGRQAMAIDVWPGSASRLASISMPTLAIAGSEDQLVPPENARYLASHIPSARLVIVDGAGHGLMFQDRTGFLAEVEGFLRE